MNILITGASGFVGKRLCKKHLQNGDNVFAIFRDKNKLVESTIMSGIFPIYAELGRIENAIDKIDREIDVAYHLAWEGYGLDPENYRIQAKNIEYTCNLTKLLVKIGCKRMVSIGTPYSYKCSKEELHQRGNYKANSIYGSVRKGANDISRVIANKAEMEFIIAIMPHIFGEGEKTSISSDIIIGNILSGENIKLVKSDSKYDWVYVDDAVAGLISIGKSGKNLCEYYIGSINPPTFEKIITDVRDVLNPKQNLYFGSIEEELYIDYTKIDTLKLFNDTGFIIDKANFKKNILKTAKSLRNKKCK